MRKKGVLYISMLDAAIILHHLHKASSDPAIGFQDIESTLKEITKDLSKQRFPVDLKKLESALWSCNMLREKKRWEPATKESFDAFVKRMLAPIPGLEFDPDYNRLNKEKVENV